MTLRKGRMHVDKAREVSGGRGGGRRESKDGNGCVGTFLTRYEELCMAFVRMSVGREGSVCCTCWHPDRKSVIITDL